MRNGLIGLVSAMAFAATIAAAGCGSSSSGGGAGGTSSSGGTMGTGGSSSSGGATGAGGSSSSGGTAVTTFSDTKALNALTTADATQLCKDVYAYFAKNIPMATACKYKGLSYATSSSPPSDAQMRQVCTDHETACTQAGSGVGSADNPGCSDLHSTCTATVAQYSSCIRDEVAAFNQGMNGLPSCATATSASMSAVWQIMTPNAPASCDSLSNICPELTPPAPND